MVIHISGNSATLLGNKLVKGAKLGEVAEGAPRVSGEGSLGGEIRHLFFGAYVFDEDAGVFTQAFKKPIKVDSVCACHM